MLLEIFEHRYNKDYLFMNQARLNVGLLASKALDFERDYDRALYDYATVLHNTWAAFLNAINQPFKTPHSGWPLFVYNFYLRHKYDHNRIGSHMTGIDFNFPVGISTLNKGFIVGQWKIPPILQGDYYADINASVKPDCLGINDLQADQNGLISRKIEHNFELQDNVDALRSVAAAVLDTWSVKGLPKLTSGGCTQYFNANDKKEFNQIYP